MKLDKQKDKKIGIFGLGITGKSTYNALKNYSQLICYDDSSETRELFIESNPEARLLPIENDEWKELDKIVLSPNIPLQFPKKHPIVNIAQANNIEISSDLELLHEEFTEFPFVGITGTNGKSTTTSLIHHILNFCNKPYQVGGNIGIACLSLEVPKDNAGYVLELSSYQIDLLKNFHLQVAVLLNITPDHLDRHGNLENYIKAKEKIFSFLNTQGVAVISVDNIYTKQIFNELSRESKFKILPISTSDKLANGIYAENFEGSYYIIDNAFAVAEKLKLHDNKYLQGNHNLENILASYSAARALGCKSSEIINAITSFKGLPHRMQYIGEVNEIRFYNDSKATNADSAEKSLNALNNIYWLAGGVPKEGGIESLVYLKDKIKKAYLFGQAKDEFAKALSSHIQCQIFNDMNEAFNQAVKDVNEIQENKLKNILLAPACASFDQFKNFEERGNKFIELVKNYINLRKNP